MNDLSKKQVGDPVYGVDGSEWKITDHNPNEDYLTFTVKQNFGVEYHITYDGRVLSDSPPTFFSEPVRIVAAQGECDFSGYEVGDEVYTRDGKPQKIYDIKQKGFRTASGQLYSLDGKYDGEQIRFHAPPQMIPSNPEAFKVPAHIAERKKAVDWENVPIDTLVEVYVKSKWKLRYFAGWKSGTPTYFCHGATSKTSDELGWATVQLSKIRLAEGGE